MEIVIPGAETTLQPREQTPRRSGLTVSSAPPSPMSNRRQARQIPRLPDWAILKPFDSGLFAKAMGLFASCLTAKQTLMQGQAHSVQPYNRTDKGPVADLVGYLDWTLRL